MTAAATTPAIRVQDLTVGFGDQIVLDHLSLDVRRGEVLGVVGASGGGKTVLMRTIIGLLPKRSGSITILDVDRDHVQPEAMRLIERRWGILFQQGALFSSLTVRQNVEFPMREYLDISDGLRQEVALAKLKMVGLSASDAEKFPAELSGGMTKRVALARALALDPEIVFLDEPTSGLDPISAGEFDTLIKTLQQTLGLTVFMVTHDLDSLNTVCDRIAALADGKVVAEGPMSGHVGLRASLGEILFPRQTRTRRGSLRITRTLRRHMETSARYILVGLFTLIAIVVGFCFVYWLNNNGTAGEREAYQIHFLGPVSGLQNGATVQLNGIRVGEVTDLRLDENNQVVATVAILKGMTLRADTGVSVDFQGLMGTPLISLKGGSPSSPVLVPNPQKPPVLEADVSAGQDLTQTARGTLNRIDKILEDNAAPIKDDRQPQDLLGGTGAQFEIASIRFWPASKR